MKKTKFMHNRILKNIIFSALLIIISIIFCTVALELYLRLTVKYSSDLEGYLLTYNVLLNTQHYQRSFVERYSSKWSRGEYDPYLGWDKNIQNGRIRKHNSLSENDNKDVYKIVTIGDSFTYGSEVGPNETYSFYMQNILGNCNVLNMGVGGYGIDQAVLKYLKYGKLHDPKLVILGIHPADYIRSSVPFFGFSKPIFKKNSKGKIELSNINISSPEEVYDELKKEILPYKIYSFEYLKSRLLWVYWKYINTSFKENYYREMDIIIEHVLSLLKQSCEQSNTTLIIVHIPHGNAFYSDRNLLKYYNKERRKHLLKIYKKIGIPYVDLLDDLTSSFSRDKIFNKLYMYRTKKTRGHLTPEGNHEVAKIIISKIKQFDLKSKCIK